MNFNLFDDIDGSVLREREAPLRRQNINSPGMNMPDSGHNGNTARFPRETPLAMAYVPFQQWGEVYSEDEAFNRGTLFPELDFPFMGGNNHE